MSRVDVIVRQLASPRAMLLGLEVHGSRTLVDTQHEDGDRSMIVLEAEEALSAAWWLGMGAVTYADELPADWVVVT